MNPSCWVYWLQWDLYTNHNPEALRDLEPHPELTAYQTAMVCQCYFLESRQAYENCVPKCMAQKLDSFKWLYVYIHWCEIPPPKIWKAPKMKIHGFMKPSSRFQILWGAYQIYGWAVYIPPNGISWAYVHLEAVSAAGSILNVLVTYKVNKATVTTTSHTCLFIWWPHLESIPEEC